MNYPKIAIKGSKTGTDVIEYLIKLGGVNRYILQGNRITGFYFINNFGYIECQTLINLKGYKILETIPNLKKYYELWER